MNREDEMLQAAQEQYPDIKYKGTKGMMSARRIEDFIRGAKWADEHPSMKLLNEAWDRVWPMLENLGVCQESINAEKELFFNALKNQI